MDESADEETGETFVSSDACNARCPHDDGDCGYPVGHMSRHRCRTDHSHRWDTEIPS